MTTLTIVKEMDHNVCNTHRVLIVLILLHIWYEWEGLHGLRPHHHVQDGEGLQVVDQPHPSLSLGSHRLPVFSVVNPLRTNQEYM